MADDTAAASVFQFSTKIDIANLKPHAGDDTTKYVEANIALIWPYSSSTGRLSLLLTERDVRLRKSKGQVKVNFKDEVAVRVAKSQLGIGDTVRLALEDITWVNTGDQISTPGSKLDWDLDIMRSIRLEIVSGSGQYRVIEYTSISPMLMNGPFLADTVSQNNGSIDITQTPLSGILANEYHTPKRFPLTSFNRASLDPFVSGTEHESGRARKRAKFGRNSGIWRLLDDADESRVVELDQVTPQVATEVEQQPIQLLNTHQEALAESEPMTEAGKLNGLNETAENEDHSTIFAATSPQVVEVEQRPVAQSEQMSVNDDDASKIAHRPELPLLDMPPPLWTNSKSTLLLTGTAEDVDGGFQAPEITTPQLLPLASPSPPMVSPLITRQNDFLDYPRQSSELDVSGQYDAELPNPVQAYEPLLSTVEDALTTVEVLDDGDDGYRSITTSQLSTLVSPENSQRYAQSNEELSHDIVHGQRSEEILLDTETDLPPHSPVHLSSKSSVVLDRLQEDLEEDAVEDENLELVDEDEEQLIISPSDGDHLRWTCENEVASLPSSPRSRDDLESEGPYGLVLSDQLDVVEDDPVELQKNLNFIVSEEELDENSEATPSRTSAVHSVSPSIGRRPGVLSSKHSYPPQSLDGTLDHSISVMIESEVEYRVPANNPSSLEKEEERYVQGVDTDDEDKASAGYSEADSTSESSSANAHESPDIGAGPDSGRRRSLWDVGDVVKSPSAPHHSNDQVSFATMDDKDAIEDVDDLPETLGSPSYEVRQPASLNVMHGHNITPTATQAEGQPDMPSVPNEKSNTAETLLPTPELTQEGPKPVISNNEPHTSVEEIMLPPIQLSQPTPMRRSQRLLRKPILSEGIESEYFTPRTTSQAVEISMSIVNESSSPTFPQIVLRPNSSPSKRASPEMTKIRPAKLTNNPVSPSISAKGRTDSTNHGTVTTSSYYAPLVTLFDYFNQIVDLIAVNIIDSNIDQSKSGPKDHFTILRLVDLSLPYVEDDVAVTAQLFRPWKDALPSVKRGDVIILRDMKVETRKNVPTLLSTSSSAWVVYHEDASSQVQRTIVDISGPPMEYGEEEKSHARILRKWWETEGSIVFSDKTAEKSNPRDLEQLTSSHLPRLRSASAIKSKAEAIALDEGGTFDEMAVEETVETIDQAQAFAVPSTSKYSDLPSPTITKTPVPASSRRRGGSRRSESVVHELRDGTKYIDDIDGRKRSGSLIHELRDGLTYIDE